MAAVVRPNTTLATVADYISDARTLLLDTNSPYRYDDASLIVALNVSLLEGRRLRPDLFLFNSYGGQVQHFDTVDITNATPVEIEEPFRLAFLHGTVGHAITRDQEDIQDQRATAMLAVMSNLLIGRAIVAPVVAQQGGG